MTTAPDISSQSVAAQVSEHDAIASCSLPRVVIGICTRKRNTLLRRLIDSICKQPVPDTFAVEIVVVDNNDRPEVADALDGLSDRFPVRVVHEPKAGLVFARNRALDEAAMRDAEWFIGVDDDEWVAFDWLATYVTSFQTTSQKVMIAACSYVYDDALSRFLRPTQLAVAREGERPKVMASGNFAIHRTVFGRVNGAGLRFDPIFNESGGEDLDFFLRGERLHGFVPSSLPDAMVYENWNGVRATLTYRLSRTLRSQICTYQVVRHHRRQGYSGSRAINLIRMLLQINRHVVFGVGSLFAGLTVLPFRRREGQFMIGNALLRGTHAVAFIPFVIGITPIAYGKRAKAH